MPLTFPAAVLFETKSPLKIVELSLPDLKEGQVLVQVAYSGLCQSQWLEIQGKRGKDNFLPHTLGHEGSGIVLRTTPKVKKVKPGDHVVLTWIKGQGADIPSTEYRSNQGHIRSGAISTFMHRTITSENRLVPISKSMPLREAALLGCAVPTGMGIVLNHCRTTSKHSIAIFGIGGIGLSVLLASRWNKLSPIVAVDIYKEKLAMARRLGATHTIDARKTDPVALIRKWTNGLGVDFAVEASGAAPAMESAFESVHNKDGLCVLAGNLPQHTRITIDPFQLIKGKHLVGSWGGGTRSDQDIPRYVKLCLTGQLDIKPLITHEFSLAQINEAFALFERGKMGRAILKCSPPEE